jgi:hypothetical protein
MKKLLMTKPLVTASLLTFSLTGANLQSLDVEAYDIPAKGVTVNLASSPAFVETTQTLPAALQPLFPYSVVLENTTGTDIIAFNAAWSTLDAQGQPHAVVTRTPWRLATPDRLTVIPAHSRLLITPVAEIPNEFANVKSLPQPLLDDIAAKTKSFGANSMRLTLDSIVFADGSKIGPDNSHTGRTAAAWMMATWKLANELSTQDPANVPTYLGTERDRAFAAVPSGTAQASSFRMFSLSEVSKSRNLQEAYLKLRSRFAEQWRKGATVSAEAVVADARSTAAQWTGLSNLIKRLGNSELAATASTQRKGEGLWEGLEVRPAVLRVGEKYQVRRADFLGLDPLGYVLYDTCNFYYSYGYTDTQDPTCDNTGYVAGGDYCTFIDNLCNETTGDCVQGYLWATSFTGFDSHNVGGNRRFYAETYCCPVPDDGVLYQDAYLDYSTSPFFEQYLLVPFGLGGGGGGPHLGTASGVVYGWNYY